MVRIAIFLFCIFSTLVVNASTTCKFHECVAVVDAGSTGSRLHIYAYDVDQTNSPINIKELWSKKIKPGIATIEANQATMDAYLTTLFSGAPEENLEVYFYATAGMRLLPQPKQHQMYVLLRQWFSTHHEWQLRNSRTITGSEEGLFGWLAVNYQLGVLSNAAKEKAVGVMDMGGASVQIIFPVKTAEGLSKKDVREFNLYGRHLILFVHSFLGLGQTEVAHQYLDTASCFAEDYELPKGMPAAGDAYSCKEAVSPLITGVHHVDSIVQPTMQANPVDQWFVLGGTAELAQSKPFTFKRQQFTNQSLLSQADAEICHQRWGSLSNQYPGNDFLYGYCLFPAYYYALMVDGYGLHPQEPVNFLSANQSGDWTLGVVLHEHSA